MAKKTAGKTKPTSTKTYGFVVMINAEDEVDCEDIQNVLEKELFSNSLFDDVSKVTVGPLGEVQFDAKND